MSETRFRLDLNLERLAMKYISTKLWNTPDAKKKVRDYYNFWNDQEKPSDYKWEEISKFVLHYADSFELPSPVLVELKKIVLIVGEKIQNWICYAIQVLKLDFDYAEKIYSTYGAIDETKIFDLHSKSIGRVQDQRTCFLSSPVFALACFYGCERFINEHKNEMMDELSQFYPQVRIGDEIYNIMSVPICSIARKNVEEFVPHPRKMFELCLEEGFSEAARFYWAKMDKIERVSNLTYFSEKCFEEKDGILLREGYSKNLIYLINQMEEEERCLFFKNNADKIIMTLLPVWPCQEFIVHLLRYDWDIESGRLLKLLNFITIFNVHLVSLECPVENELFFQVFQKAWENIAENEQTPFFHRNKVNLFWCCNLSILNLIVNDSNIQLPNSPINDELVVGFAFLRLVKIGKFHLIDELIEKILNFDPKPKEILKRDFAKIAKSLIVKDKFTLIDKFLDWLSDSEEERKRLKNEINPISMCRHLTEGRVYVKSYFHACNEYKETEKLTDFELAEKFLKWRFESDVEVKNFKEGMKSYNFIMNGVRGFRYIRIRSGDLSCLKQRDTMATISNGKITGDNVDGYTFLEFGDTTVIDHGGVVTGGKQDDYRPDANHSPVVLAKIVFVGTKPGDYVVYNIYEIWKNLIHYPNSGTIGLDTIVTNTTEMVVDLCNAFIKFYYETGEEVEQFKKTKLQVLDVDNVPELLYNRLITKNPIKIDTDFCVQSSLLNTLNEFFEFCLISSDKVEEIKIQLRNNFEKLMDNYLIDQCNFGLADFCIGWLYDSIGNLMGEEKMKNFFNSSNKGALLCFSYLKNIYKCGRAFESDLDVPLRRWVEMVDDKDKLRNDLYALDSHPPRWLVALCDDRK